MPAIAELRARAGSGSMPGSLRQQSLLTPRETGLRDEVLKSVGEDVECVLERILRGFLIEVTHVGLARRHHINDQRAVVGLVVELPTEGPTVELIGPQ